ncbi:MAG: nucleoside-diphosphate kinase [Bacteroidales bacterium]|nr:nucleoside-diphosphate kinase [Bacteroidales bacterium]
MGNYTFTMIKPTAVEHGNVGQILMMVNKDGGFRIAALKMKRMSKTEAREFYAVHKDRPFYDELVDFMTSGPVVAAVLQKENAVIDYRKFIGATNPDEAEEGSIRKTFGVSIQANCVHGSDSDENAIRESKFFFSTSEIFNSEGGLIDM